MALLGSLCAIAKTESNGPLTKGSILLHYHFIYLISKKILYGYFQDKAKPAKSNSFFESKISAKEKKEEGFCMTYNHIINTH